MTSDEKRLKLISQKNILLQICEQQKMAYVLSRQMLADVRAEIDKLNKEEEETRRRTRDNSARPRVDREKLMKFVDEGKTAQEIAEQLGCGISTVHKILREGQGA